MTERVEGVFMQIQSKQASDSKVCRSEIVMSSHINGAGRLFGGCLMQWIDIVGGISAMKHAGCSVTTASFDNLDFKEAAYAADILTLIGQVTYVGNTSIEVRVDTFLEDFSGNQKLINRAYGVYVALDENEQPKQVPRLVCEVPEEKQEWENGIKRMELRKLRRSQGI